MEIIRQGIIFKKQVEGRGKRGKIPGDHQGHHFYTACFVSVSVSFFAFILPAAGPVSYLLSPAVIVEKNSETGQAIRDPQGRDVMIVSPISLSLLKVFRFSFFVFREKLWPWSPYSIFHAFPPFHIKNPDVNKSGF